MDKRSERLTTTVGLWVMCAAAVGPATAETKPVEPGDLGATTIPISAKDGPLPLAVRWWGQACVSVETFWGFTIVVDPYPARGRLGYPPLDLAADLVLTTHNHGDHSAVEAVKGKPAILRGLTADGEWATIDHYLDRPPNQGKPRLAERANAPSVSPHAVHVRGIPVFHDASEGTERGRNMLLLIETEGVRILHCGDLGHALTEAQLAAVGAVDLLLVPVGGTYTIDAAGATQVVRQIKPRRWVWPIHFDAGVGKLPLAKRDPFLRQARDAGIGRRTVKGNTIAMTRRPSDTATDDASAEVIVSDFRSAELRDDVRDALTAMRSDRGELIDRLGKVTRRQLDHKPSNGTHTIRWNFDHTTGRELGFFSQIYNRLDPEIPVINWNPQQMPPDYRPRHPEWDTAEMVRHVERVAAFTERFSYLLADTPAEMKIEGTRFSVNSLSKLMVGHYRNHTTKAVTKFDLPDWPKADE